MALLYVAAGLWEGFRRGFSWSLGRLLGGILAAFLATKESGPAVAYLWEKVLASRPAMSAVTGILEQGPFRFWLWLALVLGGLELFMRWGGSWFSRLAPRPGPISRLAGSLLDGILQAGLAALIIGALLQIPYAAPLARESLWVQTMPELFTWVERAWSFWQEASFTP
ncbi:MAG: hypothetical protein QJR00_08605 [Bacillota bacterium]|nr:hypothetical protein [Bacillota bacterium]